MKIFSTLFFGLVIFSVVCDFALADFSSPNFTLENPINIIEGGKSSSSNFQYFSSTGQLESGESVSGTFAQNVGFLYFPTATSPVVSTTSSNTQVVITWTPATGTLANITSYDVGISTSPNGTFTYTPVGNVLTYTKTGLTNGTTYFFKVHSFAVGLLLSESAEVSATPATVVYGIETETLPTGEVATAQLLNSNNTTVVLDFPANFTGTSDELNFTMNAIAQNSIVDSMPLPSDKSAAQTIYNFSLTKVVGGEAVTSLSQPVTLTFTYTDSDISGVVENSLAVYSWNGSTWVVTGTSIVDTSANTVTTTTTHLSTFALLGNKTAPVNPPPPPPSSPGGGGGGGGRGGGNNNSNTGVAFSGRAYPLSKVSILEDGQLALSTIAGPDSNFSATLSNLSSGDYTFSVYGEDKNGLRSTPFTFQIFITSGVTTNVGGIFIAPTIAVDKSEVKKGDNITIFGQSTPSSQIVISVNSAQEFFGNASTDANGVYLHNFDTSVLELGNHSTKSKALKNGEISSFSDAVAFTVGTKNVPVKIITKVLKGDSNGDGKINLVDFSIAAFWYNKANPPAKVDLNNDGIVNLIDFSIMAYYWTG